MDVEAAFGTVPLWLVFEGKNVTLSLGLLLPVDVGGGKSEEDLEDSARMEGGGLDEVSAVVVGHDVEMWFEWHLVL